ncbi:hypothetical protein BGZ49_005518 [Haplosporangium sp. Z 27]|nr:hypothetical protein BGZ49_005518 [Haplosporangium sp. Z 27]
MSQYYGTEPMSVKPCVIKGQRECVSGFHRDKCLKCTKGSTQCNMCCSNSPSAPSCIYCLNGRKECSDCFGLGHVQRICRPCIDNHYRHQDRSKTFKKVKTQLGLAQNQLVVAQSQFSKSMVSLTSTITSSLATLPGSALDLHKDGHLSDTDVAKYTTLTNQISSGTRSTVSSLERLSLNIKNSKYIGDKAHRRKWSWSSSSNTTPSTMAAA